MYGLKYERATVANKSDRKSLQACVTIPEALRPLFKNRKQIYKSLGTTDQREAYERLSEKEAEIWRELDQANLASHPLAVAYKELVDVVLKGETPWNIEDLFDRDRRFLLEDDIRQRTSEAMGFARSAFDDFEVGAYAQTDYLKAEELLNIFVEEFRKVSEENFAPKKRGRLFSDVVKEYHNSSLFKTNKKTNEPKRQKTLDKEITQVATFMKWAGEVDLNAFTTSLATNYAEALVDPKSGLITKRGKIAGKETIDGYISSVRNVLNFATRKDYITINPWAGLGAALTGYGTARVKYRDWSKDELRQYFSMQIPSQDKLAVALLATTGARLDEIALLEWDQLHSDNTEDGKTVHWLDVTQGIVKNRPSRRMIPVLPKVWDLIQQHPKNTNEKEPDRLFTYPRGKDGKAQNKASQALNAHCRKISTDTRFAIHGLRHTFNTMCRHALIDSEMREFMVGRGGSGEGARYGQAADVSTYIKELEKLDITFLDGMLAIEKQSTKPYQMVSGWAGQKVDTGGGD